MRQIYIFPIAIMATFLLAACLGSGGGGGYSDTVTIYSSEYSTPGEPRVVLEGSGATMSIFTGDYGSGIRETSWRSQDEEVAVRVIYDQNTDEPAMIVDELTGNYTLIEENGDNRVDFLTFNSDGRYQSGVAVFGEGDTIKFGTIIGRAAFDGQVTGQLEDSYGESGSFSAIADSTETLDNIQTITPEQAALFQAVEDLLAPTTGYSANGEFETVRQGLSLSKVLKVGGAVLIGAAAVGVAAPAVGAAGVAMVISGLFSNDIANAVEKKFQNDNPFAQEIAGMAVENLRDPDSSGLFEKFEQAADSLKSMYDKAEQGLSDLGDSAFEIAEDAVETLDLSEYPNPLDSLFEEDSLTPPQDGPEYLEVDVKGQAVWQDGTLYDVDGTIDEDGNVDLTATSDTGETIDVDATIDQSTDTVSGTFSGDRQGDVTGQVEDIGACSVSQASGGQGTFTKAHFVGEGSGQVPFSYDSYSIPDAFIVRVGGTEAFNTGGLVSGSDYADIAVNGERIVFVSVYAPEADTAWDYSLGCL
jgi:hypothetical protein